jgi:hypothetical protein
MDSRIIAAIIIAAGLIVAAVVWGYFSPYQTCVREITGGNSAARCAALFGNYLRNSN